MKKILELLKKLIKELLNKKTKSLKYRGIFKQPDLSAQG